MENKEVRKEMSKLPDIVFLVAMLFLGYIKESRGKKDLIPRFKEKYIHYKGSYRRFSKNEFTDVYSQYNIKNFIDGAENIGQLQNFFLI